MALLLEIACFDLPSALAAAANGADRIELCENYSVGGITPPREIIKQAKKRIKIPIHVIIRPRGGNFVYSEEELSQMKADILFCKEQKINGIVFGILKSNRTVNAKANKKLLAICGAMQTTFHRAIDDCIEIEKQLTAVCKLGFNNVLTSGGKSNAELGIKTIYSLQKKFETKINIIPGGGIRAHNLKTIIKKSGCRQIHSSANLCDLKELKKIKKIISSFE